VFLVACTLWEEGFQQWGLLTSTLLEETAVTKPYLIHFQTIRRQCQMGKYTLDEVIKRWTRGDMTTEQVVGQTLLIVQDVARRVGTLEKMREEERNGRNPGTDKAEG
jgi:hypothetical protein